MDCRTTAAHKFRTRLGFKQYDVILTKKQTVLTKMMSSFEGGNMQTQYSVLGYRFDLYFHDYKLAIEIDENGHSNRNIDFEIKRQKAIAFIDPDKKKLMFLKLSMKCLGTSTNLLINKISISKLV